MTVSVVLGVSFGLLVVFAESGAPGQVADCEKARASETRRHDTALADLGQEKRALAAAKQSDDIACAKFNPDAPRVRGCLKEAQRTEGR